MSLPPGSAIGDDEDRALEKLSFQFRSLKPAAGNRMLAIVGVVASGNLEVMLERSLPQDCCTIDVATAAPGFTDLWQVVLNEFVCRRNPGGLRISVNDAGARPDTVMLRLAQGVRLMERDR